VGRNLTRADLFDQAGRVSRKPTQLRDLAGTRADNVAFMLELRPGLVEGPLEPASLAPIEVLGPRT